MNKDERVAEAFRAADMMSLRDCARATALETVAFQALALEDALLNAGLPLPWPMAKSYREEYDLCPRPRSGTAVDAGRDKDSSSSGEGTR